MKRSFVPLAAAIFAVSAVMAACAQAAPAPTPTKAPAAPTKAAEPTKPAAAQPTAAPAKKIDYPAKGKSITLGIPTGAGGPTDVVLRLLGSGLEKELGVPIQPVNKPAALGQVHYAELARAAPDGYTLGGIGFATIIMTHLDPERKATYSRKDFQPIALHSFQENMILVRSDSPFKDVKDLVDAAKARAGGIKAGTSGYMGNTHLAWLQFQELARVQFDIVNFDSGAAGMTALLGGHVEVFITGSSIVVPQVKSGAVRVLGVMDKDESQFLPGVKTMEAQGYKVYNALSVGLAGPAGTPAEIVEIVAAATRRATEDGEHKKKATDMGLTLRYMGPGQFATYWADMEAELKPLLEREFAKRK